MTELHRFPAVVVEQRHIEACARVAGGFGRIHLDPEFAATTRFGRPLVQGLLLAARARLVRAAAFLQCHVSATTLACHEVLAGRRALWMGL